MGAFKKKALPLIEQVRDACLVQSKYIVTAESCTGGLIASLCTELAGSSQWFERGYVTYSNRAKQELLGVSAQSIETDGAVSECVARAMAQGALLHSAAHISLATTGYAGPTADNADELGLVWIAMATKKDGCAQAHRFVGSRQQVREQAVIAALNLLLTTLDGIK